MASQCLATTQTCQHPQLCAWKTSQHPTRPVAHLKGCPLLQEPACLFVAQLPWVTLLQQQPACVMHAKQCKVMAKMATWHLASWGTAAVRDCMQDCRRQILPAPSASAKRARLSGCRNIQASLRFSGRCRMEEVKKIQQKDRGKSLHFRICKCATGLRPQRWSGPSSLVVTSCRLTSEAINVATTPAKRCQSRVAAYWRSSSTRLLRCWRRACKAGRGAAEEGCTMICRPAPAH